MPDVNSKALATTTKQTNKKMEDGEREEQATNLQGKASLWRNI